MNFLNLLERGKNMKGIQKNLNIMSEHKREQIKIEFDMSIIDMLKCDKNSDMNRI